MAIQGPWVGSSAVAETGFRWGWEQRVAVRLPRSGWYSELIGRSKEIHINVGGTTDYNKDWLIGEIRKYGSTPIVVTVTSDLCSYAAGAPTIEFPGDLASEYIHLIVNPGVRLLGRGGNGGGEEGAPGSGGGHAINNQIGGRLRITNNGTIGGGGGGGQAGKQKWSYRWHGGGGGAPLGAGGYSAHGAGGNASFDSPGGGGGNGTGAGGGWGQTGTPIIGSYDRGTPIQAAGWALAGQGATWYVRGDIRGNTA